ncbi:MAG: DNA polymerase III subunit [Clostridia bacterium]|nr:DNA polymerase III subunit [Clostridia bacterium]
MERLVFPALIGNDRLKSTLSADFAAGKSAHAYIIEGPVGSGRHIAAMQICASVLCESRENESVPLPCGTCPSCRKILGGISVDVLTVSNDDKASISVSAVRDIKETLYITPNDGDKKFYIIENAHLMTVQAQNALLLSLEEPPPYVMFFLLTEDASALLETIRSRAPVIRMDKFTPDFIEDYLTKTFGSSQWDRIVTAAHLSGGALGRARGLYENGSDEMEAYRTAEQLTEFLLTGRKSDTLAYLTAPVFKDRNKTREILNLMRFALRDLIADKRGGELLFYSRTEGVPKFAKKLSVRRLLALSESVAGAWDKINANCSVSTVLTALVTEN